MIAWFNFLDCLDLAQPCDACNGWNESLIVLWQYFATSVL